MNALQMVTAELEMALENTMSERAEARLNGAYASVSGMEVYRLAHPDHGDVYMILPTGGAVYILPIASRD